VPECAACRCLFLAQLTPLLRPCRYYDFLWSKHHSLNGKTAMSSFMDELSPNLSIEIQMCVYKDMLMNVSFFREFTADVIHMLVMSLQSKMFMPKDYVISVGECGTDMFFLECVRASEASVRAS
jgi:hypothetical protein